MKRSIDLKRLEGQIREYQPKWRKCKSELRFKLRQQLVCKKPVVSLRRVTVRSSKPIYMTADMTMGLGPQTSSLVENNFKKNKSKGRESCYNNDTCKRDDSKCGSAQAEGLPSNAYKDNENNDKVEKNACRVSRPLVDTPPEIGKSRRKSYADTSPSCKRNLNENHKINDSNVETPPNVKVAESVTFSPFRIMHRRKSCMEMSVVERTSRKIGTEPENHSNESIPPVKDKPVSNTNCTAGSSVELSPRKLRRKSCADVSPQVRYPKKDEHSPIERIDSNTERKPLSKSSKKKKSTKKKEVHFGGEKVATDASLSENRTICAKETASTSKHSDKSNNEPTSQKRHDPRKNRNDSATPAETTSNQQAIVTRNRRKSCAEFEPEKTNAKEVLLDDSPNLSGNSLKTCTVPTCAKKRSHKKKEVEIDRHTGNRGSLKVSDAADKEASEPEKKVHPCNGDGKWIPTIDLCGSSDEDDVLYVPGERNKKRDVKSKPAKVVAPDLKEGANPSTKSKLSSKSKAVVKRVREELKANATNEVTSIGKRKRGRPLGSLNKKKRLISYVSSNMESSDTNPGVGSNGATPLHEPPIKIVLRRTTKRPDLYQSSTKVHRDRRKRRTAKIRMGSSGAVASAADATQLRRDSRSSSIPMELEPRMDYVFYAQPNGAIRGNYELDKGVTPECATPSTTISSSTGHVTSTTPFFGAKNGEGYLQPPAADAGGQYIPAETEWNTMTQPLMTNAYEYNNIQDMMSHIDENGGLDASGNVITIENYQSEFVTQQSMNNGQNAIQWIASSTVTQCTESYLGQPSTVSSYNSVPSYDQSTSHPLPSYAPSTQNSSQRPRVAASSNHTFAVPMAHHHMGHAYGVSAPNPPPRSCHNLIVGDNSEGASFSEQCEPLDLSKKTEFIREPTRPAATHPLPPDGQFYTGYQQYHQQQSNIPQPTNENVCNSMWQAIGPNIHSKPAESVVSDDEDCDSTSSENSSSSSSSSSSGTSDSDSSSTDSSSSSSSDSSSLNSSHIRSEIPPVALSVKSEDEDSVPKATRDQVQTRPGEEEHIVAAEKEGTGLKSAENQVITEERLNNETPESHIVREEENGEARKSGGIKKISFNEFMKRSTQKMLHKRLEDQDQGPTERNLDEEEFIAERVSPIKDVDAICQPVVSHQETLSSFDEQRSKTPEAENSSFGEHNESQLDYEEMEDSMTQENEDTSATIEEKTPEATESPRVNEERSNTGMEVSELGGSSRRNEVKPEFEAKLPCEPLRIIDISEEIEDDQISLATSSCFSSPEYTSPTKEQQQIHQTVPTRVEEPTASIAKPEQKTPEAAASPLVQTTQSIRNNAMPRTNFRKLQLPNSKKPAPPTLRTVENARPKGHLNMPAREITTTTTGVNDPPQRNEMLLHMYGLNCWPYLVDYCTEMCTLSHNFCEPAELHNKLETLSDDDLRSAYMFMYAHERLFRRYFIVFCMQYEQRHDRDMLLMMLSDSMRYVDSGCFIYRVHSGLLGCGLNPVNACRHVLAICGRVTAPRIINTLVDIIMQTDWTMFSEFLMRFASNQPLYQFPYNTLITMAKSWYQRQDRQMAAVIFSCMLTLSAEDAMRIRESPLLTRIVEVVST